MKLLINRDKLNTFEQTIEYIQINSDILLFKET